MQRTQLIAATVLVLVALGLVAGRIAGSSDLELAAIAPGSDADSPIEPAPAGGDGTSASATPPASTGPGTSDGAADEPARLGEALPLTGLDGWLQTEAESLDDFDGQVRIVQFWTFGCHNCKATLPHLQAIYDRWHPEGLEIVGVHAPEFDYEKDPEAIADAAEALGVVWPIALDTERTSFRTWQTGRRFWPRTYVVDQQGQIRYDHIGEGNYDELEATVASLVENGPS